MATAKVKEKLAETGEFDAVTIVKSDEYGRYADLLCANLEPNKLYTHEDIKNIIETELKRPVLKDINE